MNNTYQRQYNQVFDKEFVFYDVPFLALGINLSFLEISFNTVDLK
jgi:hypothetical protein